MQRALFMLGLLAFFACDDGGDEAARDALATDAARSDVAADAAPPADAAPRADTAPPVDATQPLDGGADADAVDAMVADAVTPDATPADAAPPPDAAPPTPPIVRFEAPTEGAALRGTVTVRVEADDADDGVERVRLRVSDVPLGALEQPPWQLDWDTALTNEGEHTLHAEAEDARGAVARAAVTVRVDRTPPVIGAVTPRDAARLAPPVALAAEVEDVGGLVGVTFVITDADGAEQARLPVDAPPFATTWGDDETPAGAYALVVEATDRAGNGGASAPAAFILDRPPTVTFVAPLADAVLTGPTTVHVDVGDDLGVEAARLRVDDVDVGAFDPAGALNWTPTFAAGPRRLTARVTDLAGHVTEAVRVVEIDHPATLTLSLCAAADCGPLDAQRVRDEATLRVDRVDDDDRPTTWQVFVDDAALEVLPRPGLPFALPLGDLPDGPHRIAVRAIGGDDVGVEAAGTLEVANCDFDADGARALACGGADCDDDAGAVGPGQPDPLGDDVDSDCDGVDGVACADDAGCAAGTFCGDGACRPGCSLHRPDCPDDGICRADTHACAAPEAVDCALWCAAVTACLRRQPDLCPGAALQAAALDARCQVACAASGPSGGACAAGDALVRSDEEAAAACLPEPADRPLGPQPPFGPAARLVRLTPVDGAQLAGCPPLGSRGAGFAAFASLAPGEPDDAFEPDARGRVAQVVVAWIEGWAEGVRASELEAVQLTLQAGGQDLDGAFIFAPATPAPGWPARFDPAAVDDRLLSGATDALPLPAALSLGAPGLTLQHVRLQGRLGRAEPGFDLIEGALTGVVPRATVRAWLEPVLAACLGPAPPATCAQLAALFTGDLDADTDTVVDLMGGADVALTANGPVPCGGDDPPCDGVSVCAEVALVGALIEARDTVAQPAGGPCALDADCREGVCLTEAQSGTPGGFCLLDCAADADCGPDTVCSAPVGGSCTFACADDSHCRADWICGANGCEPGCALIGCLEGESCDPADGRCVEGCLPACGPDEVCSPSARCVAADGSCAGPDDCDLRDACRDGACVRQVCDVLANDCGPGEVCRGADVTRADGTCVAAGPVAPGASCETDFDCAQPGDCLLLDDALGPLCYALCRLDGTGCAAGAFCAVIPDWEVGICL